MSSLRRRRAFTMLELLVGLVVCTIVLTAIVSAFAETMRVQKQQRVRAELARQGAFLGNLLTRELRVIGLGRPLALSAVGNLPAPAPLTFASSAAIGFIADLPRPDATFATFGFLDDRPAGLARVAFHTDQNGACAPGTCDIITSSTLYRGDSATCLTSARDRTCPWGNKRLRDGEFFQLVAGNGSWANLRPAAGMTMAVSPSADGGGVRGLLVDTTSDNGPRAIGWPAAWTNNARGDQPVDIRGQGFVTTLDRVFYRFCGGACGGGTGMAQVLERRQCWGPVDTRHLSWPRPGGNTNPAELVNGTFTPDAVPGTTCTPWEVAARDVADVTFEYHRDRTGNAATTGNDANSIRSSAALLTPAGRASVAQVRFSVLLRRVVDGANIDHHAVGTVRIRNR